MHVGQRVAPPGLGDEGDDRGEQQDRLESFAQEDDQRTRERGAGRKLAGGKLVLGRCEQAVTPPNEGLS